MFDLERFPEWRYQFGGVFRSDGSLATPEERTYAFIPTLASWMRDREGSAGLPYLHAGFSAGGQFVSGMAACIETDAERIIAMASGSTLFPTRDVDFGLGFGKLPDELSSDERIRRYLALPTWSWPSSRPQRPTSRGPSLLAQPPLIQRGQTNRPYGSTKCWPNPTREINGV